MRTVEISNKKIGDGNPCFIIAEAGSNHNGSLELAYKLIDIAASAGSDAIKFQNFTAEEIYPPNCGQADYLNDPKSVFEIIKEMEMPINWIPKLADYCVKKNIIFFTTPDDEKNVDLVDPYVPCFKVASYEATHLPLIRYIAKKGKPIILSVGVTSVEEIEEAINEIEMEGNKNIILQHCVSAYPAPCKDYNLKVIQSLKQKFGVPIGVSDHTNNNEKDYSKNPLVIPIGSVALGSNSVEKHFTVSRELPGPDHKYAIEPRELELMVKSIRDVESALGDGVKRVMDSEKELYDFARRSLFSVKVIQKGDVFNSDNLRVLRNGKNKPGLLPKYYDFVIGKKATKRINEYTTINLDDII